MYHRYSGLGLVCLASVILAGRGEAAESLTLAQAVQRSIEQSPSLAADTLEVGASRARAQLDAKPPPWTVSAEVENFAGSGVLTGVDSAETTLRLGRVIELGGKRAAREILGAADITRREHQGRAARLQVAALATVRFVEVVADQQRLQLAEQHVELAQQARAEVARWVEAARNPETDLYAADIELANANLEREHAEHELASARVTLASTWGAMTPDFGETVGHLAELPDAPALEVLTKRLPASAAQREQWLAAQSMLARRSLARASATPDLTLGLGVRRLNAFDDHGLVLSVSVPLGTRSRAALAAAEADAHTGASEKRQQASLADTHQALFEKYQELVHAHTEYEALNESMLPSAERALGLARRGFDSGRFPFATLVQAQNTVLALRRRSIDSAARYHTLLAEVEHLTAVIPEPTS
jgi:cobalt-zinc-cadmium efflux system outer membrane protein